METIKYKEISSLYDLVFKLKLQKPNQEQWQELIPLEHLYYQIIKTGTAEHKFINGLYEFNEVLRNNSFPPGPLDSSIFEQRVSMIRNYLSAATTVHRSAKLFGDKTDLDELHSLIEGLSDKLLEEQDRAKVKRLDSVVPKDEKKDNGNQNAPLPIPPQTPVAIFSCLPEAPSYKEEKVINPLNLQNIITLLNSPYVTTNRGEWQQIPNDVLDVEIGRGRTRNKPAIATSRLQIELENNSLVFFRKNPGNRYTSITWQEASAELQQLLPILDSWYQQKNSEQLPSTNTRPRTYTEKFFAHPGSKLAIFAVAEAISLGVAYGLADHYGNFDKVNDFMSASPWEKALTGTSVYVGAFLLVLVMLSVSQYLKKKADAPVNSDPVTTNYPTTSITQP